MYDLSFQTHQATVAFIDRYNLHSVGRLPVPIFDIARRDGWLIQHTTGLWPALGFAVVCRHVRIARIDMKRSGEVQRFTLAHELGHVLAGHAGQVHLCRGRLLLATDPRGREEREADASAALLLVPAWAADIWAGNYQELARRCQVPRNLARLRLSLPA